MVGAGSLYLPGCWFESSRVYQAAVVGTADTTGLNPVAERRTGSNPVSGTKCSRGVIGRRDGLRSRCRKAWRFESSREYQASVAKRFKAAVSYAEDRWFESTRWHQSSPRPATCVLSGPRTVWCGHALHGSNTVRSVANQAPSTAGRPQLDERPITCCSWEQRALAKHYQAACMGVEAIPTMRLITDAWPEDKVIDKPG